MGTSCRTALNARLKWELNVTPQTYGHIVQPTGRACAMPRRLGPRSPAGGAGRKAGRRAAPRATWLGVSSSVFNTSRYVSKGSFYFRLNVGKVEIVVTLLLLFEKKLDKRSEHLEIFVAYGQHKYSFANDCTSRLCQALG